jgi:purine-binding chemotaxis protein CheW
LASTEPNAESTHERKTLLVRVGEDILACEIDLVREIVRLGTLTRVPGAPPFVRGLLNVRGEVLSVLDVGKRLHPDRKQPRDGSVVVVDVNDRLIGLVVEEVIGVHVVPPTEPPKEAVEDASGIVRHLGHLDGRIVLELDVPAFVNQSLV